MALIVATGLEWNHLRTASYWHEHTADCVLGEAGNANYAISTTTPNSGTYCLQCGDATGGYAMGYVRIAKDASAYTTDKHLYQKFYLYLATWNTGGRQNDTDGSFGKYVWRVTTNQGFTFSLRFASATRQLQYYSNGVSRGTGSTTLATGTWHEIDVHCHSAGGGVDDFEVRIGGTQDFRSQNVGLPDCAGYNYCTAIGGGYGAAQLYRFDDIIIQDSTGSYQNSWVTGGLRVGLLRPASVADAGTGLWTGGAGGAVSATPVSNRPPAGVAEASETNSTNIQCAAGDDTVVFTTGTYTAASVGTIECVVPFVRRGGTGAVDATNELYIDLVANPNVSNPQTLTAGDGWPHGSETATDTSVRWVNKLGRVTQAPSVTKGTGANISLRGVNDASSFCVDALGLIVLNTSTVAPVTTTQTITARAAVRARTQKTIAALARIRRTVSQTVTAVARIASTLTSSQTITARAAIRKTASQTISAVGRVRVTVQKTISAVGRIYGVVQKTITATARIRVTTPKTINALARIYATVQKTVTAVAEIAARTQQTITAISRIRVRVQKTITAVANIYSVGTSSQTITAIARIQATVQKTVSAVASIYGTTQKTITAIGRVRVTVQKTIAGISRIRVTVPKTITALAAVRNTTQKTITARAWIIASVQKTITAVARIRVTVPRTITAVSRIYATVQKTVAAVSRIRVTTQKTISAVAAVKVATIQTVTAIARIRATVSSTVTALARVQVTTQKTITARAWILALNSVQKTITSVARIQRSVSQTVAARAYIVVAIEAGVHNLLGTITQVEALPARITKIERLDGDITQSIPKNLQME